jgi:hypothetical protein
VLIKFVGSEDMGIAGYWEFHEKKLMKEQL